MARLGDVGRVRLGALLGRLGDAFERSRRAGRDERAGGALRGAGQKGALAEIHARVEVHHRLAA